MNKEVKYTTQPYNPSITKSNVYISSGTQNIENLTMWQDPTIEKLQQKINHLYEKEELHLDRIDELTDRVVKLETNRDELKKWLEEFQEDYCYDTDVEYFCKDENVEIKVQDVLDKMQELERGKE